MQPGFLADAIAAGRKITVIADYDCDGATACAVALRGLRLLGANVDYMVPNRFDNGYGLTPEIVRQAKEHHQTDIILTVDNGIASIKGIEEALASGMQVLVTDHHLPGDELPQNCIVVNPNQPDCSFPSKNLAGVGVMFYVLLALRAEMRRRRIFDEKTQPHLDQLLDLVALGTFADVVKLDANNRILVAQGLRRIRAGNMQPGMAALFQVSGRDFRKASPFDLGFTLGPRLNAAGRLSDMSLGIECLITDDRGKALEMADELNRINVERREIEADHANRGTRTNLENPSGRPRDDQYPLRRLASGDHRHSGVPDQGKIFQASDGIRPGQGRENPGFRPFHSGISPARRAGSGRKTTSRPDRPIRWPCHGRWPDIAA